MSSAPTPGRLKGTAFKGLLKALEALHGKDTAQRCVDATPEGLRNALKYGELVSGGWYPVSWYTDLHAAISTTLGTGSEKAAELSRHATKSDLENVYRVASVLLSPDVLFKQSMKMLRLYFDGGKIETLDAMPGRVLVRFTGFDGYSTLCWADLLGGALACLECARAVSPAYQVVKGAGHGDSSAEALFTWQSR